MLQAISIQELKVSQVPLLVKEMKPTHIELMAMTLMVKKLPSISISIKEIGALPGIWVGVLMLIITNGMKNL
jgi:hypothetical protein